MSAVMSRVLLVLEPPDGGVAENVMQLALGLGERGFATEVAGPPEAIIFPRLREAGVPVHPVPFTPGFSHPLKDAVRWAELARLVGHGGFNLIHAHSAKAGMMGRIAALARRLPVVYSPHCFPFVGPWGWPRRMFALTVERGLGRWTDRIVCVAADEKRLAVEERVAPAERLTVVHNGCSAPPGGLEPDERLERLRAAGPLAACLAVLRPQKSIHVFLEAAPRILSAMPEARLAVIGDGPQKAELEARARELGIADRLPFISFRPPAFRQLASLDVFVLPSAWEAFPISVVEALASGVPQVATDVGGTREALLDGRTGLLCPPGDPAALAERIGALLGDPARRQSMSENSRQRWEQNFTLDAMLDATAVVYEDVLAGRARAKSS